MFHTLTPARIIFLAETEKRSTLFVVQARNQLTGSDIKVRLKIHNNLIRQGLLKHP